MAITKDKINRINELAKKKKESGLTDEEAAEQKILYREYIEAFKANLKAQLDTIEVIDDDKKEVDELEETLSESEKKLS